ncbi:MerR family transcriptional regulator [Rhizobium ruizarguesonis]|jgi:DNA-binding transcriptional MerR regulator|uniref:MerR family transcriptional regulator n=2 Tax=Rhizobium TaxID=379 RepID=A0ABY1WXR9_9HYPH|nr:MerR family transcriptional regulator [Rhizobium anhuiense bv. trifolii]MBA9036455.1 DNA-binding transcriptional MerR regulator [Rhizobium leguminosarum]TAU60406.1 MerR family transcriptional regulator [Rhizobium ruizarguesonis]TAU60537.1 MerR family transcriptional regulator [Rhizobium ruizarguesonis]TAU93546.1 MerR family transcriptional regulator [Rhizobium leguminosarum]
MNPKKIYTIAEAARSAGSTPSTLRLWEKEGLVLPDRSKKGHRRYDDNHIKQLKRIASRRAGGRLTTAGIREDLGNSSPEAGTPRDASDATPEMKLEHLEDANTRLKRMVLSEMSAIREIVEVEVSSPEAGTPRDVSDASSEIKRLRQFEDENALLKQTFAELTLVREKWQEVIRRKL